MYNRTYSEARYFIYRYLNNCQNFYGTNNLDIFKFYIFLRLSSTKAVAFGIKDIPFNQKKARLFLKNCFDIISITDT